ncbi:MAG TPA: ATP-binding protein [Polyangiaceae bacterium]
MVGQERAVEALRFGIGIRRPGYNLFAVGPAGVGKQTLLRQYLREHAVRQNVPSDWCYVHGFGDAEHPRALELPAGMGIRFQADMECAVAELRVAMQSAFDAEEYRKRKTQIVGALKEKQQRSLSEVQDRAKQRDVAVLETESGLVLASIRGGAVIEAESFQVLSKEEQEKIHAEMARVDAELQEHVRKVHEWGRQSRETLKAIERETAASVARRVLDGVRPSYADLPSVAEYLSRVERDVVDSAEQFLEREDEDEDETVENALTRALRREQEDDASLRRYRVNVLIDNGQNEGAPVIYEDNPTHANLVGRVAHESQFGTLVAHFTLIRAGALHRAMGGYLVLDALKVLQQPFAWDALKRTIRSGQVRIEALGDALGLVPTVSVEPAPIAFGNTKIVLCGEPTLYYLLAAFDPDFLELFKVMVDFESTMDRQPENEALYARLVATLVGKEELRAFDRGAVARVMDQAARSADDAEKLSIQMCTIADLLREADYWAGEAKHDVVTAEDVQRALDAQLDRSGRARQRLQEAVRRGDILVSTSGVSIGQVNGLSVFQFGEHVFGHPTRITARARLGKGEVIDIEREVELGGPLHAKGVLILAGFVGSRYATRCPLSLSATLVFEQSYGAVEGDSASLAELCALLSALSEAPIRQSFAITGSINQQGVVQSIGAVNEKIEGFFDTCKETGLTGEQGVLIPKSNVKNLMLRRDVVAAVESSRFHVYAVENVDDAIELLTGTPAGIRDSAGKFPDGSVNGLVEQRLLSFANSARAFRSERTML